ARQDAFPQFRCILAEVVVNVLDRSHGYLLPVFILGMMRWAGAEPLPPGKCAERNAFPAAFLRKSFLGKWFLSKTSSPPGRLAIFEEEVRPRPVSTEHPIGLAKLADRL